MNSLMVQGTSSSAGKSTLVTALCRIFSDKGFSVTPFKSQNMSNFSYKTKNFEISRAQAIQAIAARCEITPEINPILLKPLGNYFSDVYLNGKKFKKMHANDYYHKFVNSKGFTVAKTALNNLQKKFDLVIIEGAGSPAEINLQSYDIANMRMANLVNAPVLLISDIERGGSFASLVGTFELIEKKYQKLVQGFILNKFLGDPAILRPGFTKLKKLTGIPTLGVIPKTTVSLPEEDSLGKKSKPVTWNSKTINRIDDEINKLSKLIQQNLNIKAIERMIR